MGPGGLGSQALGVVAGGNQQRRRGVDTDSVDGQQLRSGGLEERVMSCIEALELVVEVTDRWADELSEALVAAVTGSAELFARSPWATNLGIARPFRRPWSWSGPVTTSWRIWTMALARA